MFSSPVVADPPVRTPEYEVDPPELIPLSVVALDLLPAPADWSAFLADRGIEIVLDDIGRAAITRADARRLFDERREAQAKAREMRAAAEKRAVEQDQQFRAQLGTGIPASVLSGMSYAEAMHAAELDSQQYRPRASVIADALDNSGMTFHPIRHGGDES
jgi:hypothetical protein